MAWSQKEIENLTPLMEIMQILILNYLGHKKFKNIPAVGRTSWVIRMENPYTVLKYSCLL